MELHNIHTAAALFLLQLFLCLVFLLSSSTAQTQYFVNCGSSENVTSSDGRTFVGDAHPTTQFCLSGHRSEIVRNSNQTPNSSGSLYQTARVFRRPSTYDFNIPENGTYILRFHFCAFPSAPELADAKFNVSAAGHMLLPNFGVDRSAVNSTVLKEFFLHINNIGKLQIYFVPNDGKSTMAFVNAIEVISTRQNIIEDTGSQVTPAEANGRYKGQNSEVLQTVYRINVGGQEVSSSSDTYWRTWKPDDTFLINKDAAQNVSAPTSVNYHGPATVDDAPKDVYATAKTIKPSPDTISNLTWKFNVSKGTTYFVRSHFCDIVDTATGNYMFNLYIFSKYTQQIYPLNITRTVATPFYEDYIVQSDDLGIMNISIGPVDNGGNRTKFFLNGIEIMQIQNVTALEPPDTNSHVVLIVSLVVPVVALIVMSAVIILFRKNKKKKKPDDSFEWTRVPPYGGASSNNKTPDSQRSSSHASKLSNLQLGLIIPLSKIKQVTSNFDSNLIIGEGGFGKVYEGTLKNGVKVAVKRSNPNHGQGIEEFQREIIVLSQIRHRHLVSLIGYCYEEGEMILVYEFMERGTLRQHLYDSRGGSNSHDRVGLSWKQRLEICIGAAKGLDYLHTGSERGIMHRDVKSTNILLDKNYVAKVADFGLSKSQHVDQTQISLNVKGTFGYMDPEWYLGCLQPTEKSDVYAFGVVLFEALCARPVIDQSLPQGQVNLADWATICFKKGNLENIIDPLLAGEINSNSLKAFAETAEKCLKESAEDRPPMSDVRWDLEYALQLQKMAGQKGLQEDSTTDASLTMQLPAVQSFPSQSFADAEGDSVLMDTTTREVLSQLRFDDDISGSPSF